MSNYKENLEQFGLKVPEILLPADKNTMSKWAVIACDQYTSQLDYWQKVEEFTAGTPSTLNLIYPECYLEEDNPQDRIKKINNNMKNYIANGIFSDPLNGFILIKRDTPNTKNRWGLVAALDLEKYDFNKGSSSMIRATEGTILERIPPRVRIRENADLELPHIMVLIDDPDRSLIEPVAAESGNLTKIYDFDLMMNSGHLTGYLVDNEKHLKMISEAISKLGAPETLQKKYQSSRPFIFAMGDGNHSLATAKTIWESYKAEHSKDPDCMNHPARWALVEIVNIFSEGIEFEAIHRVLFNCDPERFLSGLQQSEDFNVSNTADLNSMLKQIEDARDKQLCGFCSEDGYGIIEALNPDSSIIAGTIQNYIDKYLSDTRKASVDYIHGVDVTEKIGRENGNVGIFLPAIAKDTFFQTVIDDGAFPRKTFSMGEAFEKRFYVESRKIK